MRIHSKLTFFVLVSNSLAAAYLLLFSYSLSAAEMSAYTPPTRDQAYHLDVTGPSIWIFRQMEPKILPYVRQNNLVASGYNEVKGTAPLDLINLLQSSLGDHLDGFMSTSIIAIHPIRWQIKPFGGNTLKKFERITYNHFPQMTKRAYHLAIVAVRESERRFSKYKNHN